MSFALNWLDAKERRHRPEEGVQMGRGLVIGSTRLFAAAECILNATNSSELRALIKRHQGEGFGSEARIRTRAPTSAELTEARAMLVRMGFLPSVAEHGVVCMSESLRVVEFVRQSKPRLTQRTLKERSN